MGGVVCRVVCTYMRSLCLVAPLSKTLTESFAGSSPIYLKIAHNFVSHFDHLASTNVLMRSPRPVALTEELLLSHLGNGSTVSGSAVTS